MGFKLATEKQVQFIEKLVAERQHGAMYVTTQIGDKPLAQIGSVEASNIIGVLLNEPKTETALLKAYGPKKTIKVAGEGLYRNDEGVFIKVQQSKTSGNLYAKRLQYFEGAKKGSFVYEAGLIYTLRPEHKVTLEQGILFSGQVGFCCMCGRTLTAKSSVDAGIGPICSSKF